MEIRIQSVHFDASEKLEAFIEKKVSKLGQYFDGIIVAEITLRVVKPETVKNKQASIQLQIKNNDCFAEKTADSFEEAVDIAVVALEKQLVKYKEKSRTK
jgi:putative sigma-54 modulation protein